MMKVAKFATFCFAIAGFAFLANAQERRAREDGRKHVDSVKQAPTLAPVRSAAELKDINAKQERIADAP